MSPLESIARGNDWNPDPRRIGVRPGSKRVRLPLTSVEPITVTANTKPMNETAALRALLMTILQGQDLLNVESPRPPRYETPNARARRKSILGNDFACMGASVRVCLKYRDFA